MGRALLFIVMAAALGGSLLIHQSHSTSLRTGGELNEHGAQVLAREAAKSGFGIALSDLRLDFRGHDARHGLVSPNDHRATYDIEIEETNRATVRLVATGRFEGYGGTGEHRELWQKAHRIQGEAIRVTTSGGSGLVINSPAIVPQFNGVSFEVSGEDTRPGDAGHEQAGVGSGGSAITVSTEDLLNTLRPTNPNLRRLIHGVNGEADITIGDLPAWAVSVLQTARANPDVVYPGNVNQTTPIEFGTASDPQVVVIDGSARFNNAGNGGVIGHGILFVDGDLHLGGNFQWNGIIVARKRGAMNVAMEGHATVYGTVIIEHTRAPLVVGGGGGNSGNGGGNGGSVVDALTLTMQGNAGIYYSQEAIGRLADLDETLDAATEVRLLDQRSGDPTMPGEGLGGY